MNRDNVSPLMRDPSPDVLRILAAAAGPIQPRELAGEGQARTMYEVGRSTWSARRPRKRMVLVASAAVPALLMAGTTGLAAASALPPAANQMVNRIFQTVDLPAPAPVVTSAVTPVTTPVTQASPAVAAPDTLERGPLATSSSCRTTATCGKSTVVHSASRSHAGPAHHSPATPSPTAPVSPVTTPTTPVVPASPTTPVTPPPAPGRHHASGRSNGCPPVTSGASGGAATTSSGATPAGSTTTTSTDPAVAGSCTPVHRHHHEVPPPAPVTPSAGSTNPAGPDPAATTSTTADSVRPTSSVPPTSEVPAVG